MGKKKFKKGKKNKDGSVYPEINQDVLTFIEELLGLALTGDLQAIAVVAQHASIENNKNTSAGWAGIELNNTALLGEIEILKRDLMNVAMSPFDNERNEITDEESEWEVYLEEVHE